MTVLKLVFFIFWRKMSVQKCTQVSVCKYIFGGKMSVHKFILAGKSECTLVYFLAGKN
jgi:hypothetical protein